MKLTTKCATALVALMAVSTLGGGLASAADTATSFAGTGKVTVGEAEDTEDPDGKTVDPEEKDDKGTPDEIDVNNKTKGPIKVEQVSQLNFGNIQGKAGAIQTFAQPVLFTKDSEGKELTTPKKRGALVQFADVRSDVYGYTLTAAMTQQFSNTDKSKQLGGASITYKSPMLKAGTGNENIAPEAISSTFTLAEDGAASTVLTADKTKQEGKGRYTLEFGQSSDYNSQTPGAGQNGTAGSLDESVALNIPTNTASNMAKGNYDAKITWSVVVAP